MIPIVIPLSSCGGKLRNNTELKFALRSIEKHFKDECQIAIVSKSMPSGFHGIEHIPSMEGLKTALVDAATRFPDGFFWYYDDCCLLKDATAETLQFTAANKSFGKVSGGWSKMLEKVRVRLESEGLPTLDYSRPHGPYWFDKAMIDESFQDWPGMKSKFPFESWILNKRRWPCRHGAVRQYNGPFNRPPDDSACLLNYDDKGCTNELLAWLGERFPVASRWEREPDKLTERTQQGTSLEEAKIHVICLNGYSDRRPFMEASIVKNGGPISATDVEWRLGTPSEKTVCPPSFRKGMIRRHWWAATCDHISILEDAILRDDAYLLVLEDDAMLTDDFESVLRKAWAALPIGWKALRLGWNGEKSQNSAQESLHKAGNEQGMIATLWSREGILRFYDHTWHRRSKNIDAAFADLRTREPNAGWYQTPKRIVVDNPMCVQSGRESRGVTVKPHPGGGLFSQINKIVTVMEHHQTSKVFVDWAGIQFYQSGGNLFDSLFKQTATVGAGSQVFDVYPHGKYTGPEQSSLYRSGNEWRERLHEWWRTMSVHPEILESAEHFFSANQPDIAVHIRNYKIGDECPSRRAPSLDQYREVVESVEGKIFLATDNDEALDYFQKHFPGRIVARDIERSPDMQTELHRFRDNTLEDAKNCLVDALVMARCKILVHSVSNISTAVLYMNPGISHIFVDCFGATSIFQKSRS